MWVEAVGSNLPRQSGITSGHRHNGRLVSGGVLGPRSGRLLLQYASVSGLLLQYARHHRRESSRKSRQGDFGKTRGSFVFVSALGRRVFVGPRAPVSIVASNRPSSFCLGGCLKGCCCSMPKGTQGGHRTGVPNARLLLQYAFAMCVVLCSPFRLLLQYA